MRLAWTLEPSLAAIAAEDRERERADAAQYTARVSSFRSLNGRMCLVETDGGETESESDTGVRQWRVQCATRVRLQ